MKYIHLFESVEQFNEAYNGQDYEEPWVSYTRESEGFGFNKKTPPTPPSPELEPLTFNILSDGVVGFTFVPMGGMPDEPTGKTIEYKINDGEWTSLTAELVTGDTPYDVNSKFNVHEGDVVQFRGDNSTYSYFNSGDEFPCACSMFICDTDFNVEGNIMSLVDSTGFTTATTLTENATFAAMFAFCTNLVSAENLVLPATELSYMCYAMMFGDFFGGGNKLKTAPALPATTLAKSCYYEMFIGCTSLAKAPELPATTLSEECYQEMFFGCVSLNYIKCLATDISAINCTANWLINVASIGTFVKSASMNDWEIGSIYGIPEGWVLSDRDIISISTTKYTAFESGGSFTLIVNSPFCQWTATTEDSWITLSQMTGNTGKTTVSISITQTNEPRSGSVKFSDGYDVYLNIIQNDFINMPLTFDILTDGDIKWVLGSAGEFQPNPAKLSYKKNDDDWVTIMSSTGDTAPSIQVVAGDKLQFKSDNIFWGYGHSRFRGTASFNVSGNINSLNGGRDKLQNEAYYSLFSLTNVISAENLVLPSMELAYDCYGNMFYGCSGLTAAPELPATNLSGYCYANMFQGCTSLTTAPELPATTLANYCYSYMFCGCTSLNYIKCLATDIPSSNCTSNWVKNVSSTGTFVKDPNMTSWTTGINGIPYGWTVQDAS